MQRELKEMPGVVQMAGGDVDPEITYFVNNMTVPDVDFFLHQLEIVDNAACSWLSMLKVRAATFVLRRTRKIKLSVLECPC